jgi:hypothetical protein
MLFGFEPSSHTGAAAWRCVVLQVSPDVANRGQHGADHGEQNDNQDRRLKRIRRDVCHAATLSRLADRGSGW